MPKATTHASRDRLLYGRDFSHRPGPGGVLAAVVGQPVIRVIEPSENEATFAIRGPGARKHDGPAVHSIKVTKFGEDE